MKKKNIKTIIFSLIIILSIIRFVFGYSVLIMMGKNDRKDIRFFSNKQIICWIGPDYASIKQVKEYMNNIYCVDYALLDRGSRDKYIHFNDAFLNQILEDEDINIDGDVFINFDSKGQCFEENEESWIIKNGKKLKVNGNFKSPKYEVDDFGNYYNLDSINLKDYTKFDYLIIDMGEDADEKSINETCEKLNEIFPEKEIHKFIGGKEGDMNFANKYAVLIFAIGLIIAFNCIDFTDNWIKYYDKELIIRRRLGAQTFNNIMFIVKKYSLIVVISTVIGIAISYGIKKLLDTDKFKLLASLVCKEYGFMSILFGVATSILISGTMLFVAILIRKSKRRI